MTWADEHSNRCSSRCRRRNIMKDLRANFVGECTEVGMYLAMARRSS